MAFHFSERRAGALLHPTSLPSGTFADAYRWLDFMAEAGLKVWQVLPLATPQAGLSPYTALSAFALNPALGNNLREPLARDLTTEAYKDFRLRQQHWLNDFALYTVIKDLQNGKCWVNWPTSLRNRHPGTLLAIQEQHQWALDLVRWQQFQLYQQWQKIRAYAAERNIGLFGDMPLFVAHDSADVWAAPERFLLDSKGHPIQVAGVPPDYFSATGQRWGNPQYDWETMRNEGFSWWKDRLHYHFECFDWVRLDHFRGLEAVWMIYADSDTAIDGFWQPVPGDELLAELQAEMGEIPLVAEDLGIITEEVKELKAKYRLPGMSILQFSFDAFDDNPHKPKNITPNTVVYTGTHDNDTTQGWYDALPEDAKQHVLSVLKLEDEAALVDRMIQTALDCPADMAIIPLQDFLHLGSEARMNTPGTVEDNWSWRFRWDALADPALARHIHTMIKRSGR